MKVFVSKITSKGQATIPSAVRRTLGLKAGDRVAFRMEGNQVALVRAQPMDLEFAAALEPTLAGEWLSEEDQAAYGSL